MRVLGLIPARGGSKGVPRKNIRVVEGRPLLWYTAQAAHAATRLTRVILNTDDEEIAEVGRACGLEVPFMRSAALGTDDTSTLAVIQDTLNRLEAEADHFDAVCLLQPTNPLRDAGEVDACIALLEASGADSVVTIRPVPAEHNPHWVYFRADDGTLALATGESAPLPRRQLLPPAFHRAGSVYVTRSAVIRDGSLFGRRTLGVEVSAHSAINIDSVADLDLATAALRERAGES